MNDEALDSLINKPESEAWKKYRELQCRHTALLSAISALDEQEEQLRQAMNDAHETALDEVRHVCNQRK